MCSSHPLIGGQCLLHLALGAMMFEYPRGLRVKCHKVFCAILALPLEVRCLLNHFYMICEDFKC